MLLLIPKGYKIRPAWLRPPTWTRNKSRANVKIWRNPPLRFIPMIQDFILSEKVKQICPIIFGLYLIIKGWNVKTIVKFKLLFALSLSLSLSQLNITNSEYRKLNIQLIDNRPINSFFPSNFYIQSIIQSSLMYVRPLRSL